jgi:hypothetical protein
MRILTFFPHYECGTISPGLLRKVDRASFSFVHPLFSRFLRWLVAFKALDIARFRTE